MEVSVWRLQIRRENSSLAAALEQLEPSRRSSVCASSIAPLSRAERHPLPPSHASEGIIDQGFVCLTKRRDTVGEPIATRQGCGCYFGFPCSWAVNDSMCEAQFSALWGWPTVSGGFFKTAPGEVVRSMEGLGVAKVHNERSHPSDERHEKHSQACDEH